MQDIYLLIGVAASGKSWICRQLTHKFEYVAHDRCWYHPDAKKLPKKAQKDGWGPPGSVSTHLRTLLRKAKQSKRPVITEVPFGETKLIARIKLAGLNVIPVFVIEDAKIIKERYLTREHKPIPRYTETRIGSLKNRALEYSIFEGSKHGTSAEILGYLEELELPGYVTPAATPSALSQTTARPETCAENHKTSVLVQRLECDAPA